MPVSRENRKYVFSTAERPDGLEARLDWQEASKERKSDDRATFFVEKNDVSLFWDVWKI